MSDQQQQQPPLNSRKRPADDVTEPPRKRSANRTTPTEGVLATTARQIERHLDDCLRVVKAVAKVDGDMHAYLNGLPCKSCAHDPACPIELGIGLVNVHDGVLALSMFRCGRYLGAMQVIANGSDAKVRANEPLVDSFTSARPSDVRAHLQEMITAAMDTKRKA